MASPALLDPTPRSERGFWALAALQFQGALSDNILKQFIVIGLVAQLFNESEQSLWNGVISLVFVLPGFLVSIWAGQLADIHSKRTIAVALKGVEVVIMCLATAVFMLGDPQRMFWPAIFVLFLLSNQFSFFSPAKYGIIPELVSPRRLSWANGVIELSTFVAIIMGSGVVPPIIKLLKRISPGDYHYVGFLLIGLAAAGFVCGLAIDRTPPAAPGRPFEINFIPQFIRYTKMIRGDRRLLLTVFGLCYFWFIGVLVLTHVNVWGEASLGLKPEDAGWLYIVLSLGIGLGAMAGGYLSRGTIELGLIPLGSMMMAVFCLPLAFARPNSGWLLNVEYVSLFMVGVGAGFFSLPLFAMLQHNTAVEDRGGLISASNLFNSASMVIASIFLIGFNWLFKPPANALFFICVGLSVAATWIIIKLLPEALVRFVAFILTRSIYRIRPIGLQNLPESGGALILCNHVSYVDALLLGSISQRPIRFLAYAEFFDKPLLGYFLKSTRSIPIASDQKPRELIKSLKAATDALNAGELVCLFPEGQLTRTGQLNPFNRGYELILKDAPVPIVPVYLDGVWGSIFSYEGRKFLWKRPRRIPYPVRVVFGGPVPAQTPPFEMQRIIQELGAEGALAARGDRQTLELYLIQNVRRWWGRHAMVDALTPAMTWGRALTGAIFLARKLAPFWKDQKHVGIMLPPSSYGALVNYAAALSGRAAINLNYTLGQEALDYCAREAEVKTVVTARKFLEKTGLKAPAEAIFIEDFRDAGSKAEKLLCLLAARFLFAGLIPRFAKGIGRPAIGDTATVIFSSGSTGVPKGVRLTHFNVASNIESFRQAVQFFPDDRMLSVLPFFHSFGFTVSLWGGACLPFGSVFHNNPLDAKTVGDLAVKEKATLLIATPTFMQMYIRRIPPAQFGGMQMVVAGAERLPEAVSEAFKQTFGIEPLQGYGTTECSPVVSVNVPDHRSPGIHQIGAKAGSVGHPLPGIAVRVVGEDGTILGVDEPGLLHVRGANVMEGYLNNPKKSAEVLKDGWYNTGDVAKIDEDGFIFITGRLSRFSKIGGEMVPHGTVEDKLQELSGQEERALAVAGVPDEKKGEQLVVLHTLDDAALEGLLEKLPGSGLPNLFIPKKEMFFRIEALPMLGTGKLDLKEVGRLAKKKAEGK